MKQSKLAKSHTSESIQKRLQSKSHPSFMKDFIYGSIDGVVTTFAVVASVAAAGLSSGVVILLGIANLVADGFSMAIGNYLGTKAEKDGNEKIRANEYWEVETIPTGEREEVRQIYAAKGFEGKLLESIVDVITSNKERWVSNMMTDEHGISKQTLRPTTSALITFSAFFTVGSIPLLSFIFEHFMPQRITSPFFLSSILTAVAFFTIGIIKAVVMKSFWLKEGITTLMFGGLAAAIAYGIGSLLKPFLDS